MSRTVPAALRARLRTPGVTPYVRIELDIPGEIYIRFDSLLDAAGSEIEVISELPVPSVSVVFDESADYPVSGSANAGELAQSFADAVNSFADFPTNGLYAQAEYDGRRSGMCRIQIAKGLEEPEAEATTMGGTGTPIVIDNSHNLGRTITLHSNDVPLANHSGFGTILSVEPLRAASDPISKQPIGQQLIMTLERSAGLERIFSYHPVHALEARIFLGAALPDGTDEQEVSLGRWWGSKLEGNSDGTFTFTVKDSIARLDEVKLVPTSFPTLHPAQAALLHLHAAGLSNNSGVVDSTFDPTNAAATKGHFVVANPDLAQAAENESRESSPNDPVPVLEVVGDFMILLGDFLRLNANGDIVRSTFDRDAPAVEHLRTGPDDGFDATIPEVQETITINRLVWSLPSRRIDGDEGVQSERTPRRIEQVVNSKRSQDWLNRIEDYTINSPYTGRPTGAQRATGSEWQRVLTTSREQAWRSIYSDNNNGAGVDDTETRRFIATNPHLAGWCGFRLEQTETTLTNDLVPPAGEENLTLEDSVADVNAGTPRRLYIRLDPPHLFRKENAVAPGPNEDAWGGVLIEPGDSDYSHEIIAVSEVDVIDNNNNTEAITPFAIWAPGFNSHWTVFAGFSGVDGDDTQRVLNAYPPPPYPTTITVPRLMFRNFVLRIDATYNGDGRINAVEGREVLGTQKPFRWRLNSTYEDQGASLTDVTIPILRSNEIFDQFEFGAPIIEFNTWLDKVNLEIGDVITIDDPSYMGFGRIGLDDTITFQIIEQSIFWLSDQPRIEFLAIALKDSGQGVRFSNTPTSVPATSIVTRPTINPIFIGAVGGIARDGDLRRSLSMRFRSHDRDTPAVEGTFSRQGTGEIVVGEFDVTALVSGYKARISAKGIGHNTVTGATKSFELGMHLEITGSGPTFDKFGDSSVLEEDGPISSERLVIQPDDFLTPTKIQFVYRGTALEAVRAALAYQVVADDPGAGYA